MSAIVKLLFVLIILAPLHALAGPGNGIIGVTGGTQGAKPGCFGQKCVLRIEHDRYRQPGIIVPDSSRAPKVYRPRVQRPEVHRPRVYRHDSRPPHVPKPRYVDPWRYEPAPRYHVPRPPYYVPAPPRVVVRMSCSHARNILLRQGFRSINARDCSGWRYVFTARLEGHRYYVTLHSGSGIILSARPY